MKKYRQALIILVFIILLIVMRTPLVFSQREVSGQNNLETSLEIIQTQASSQKVGAIVSEIPAQSAKSNQQDIPVILDGETLFNFSTKVKGLSADNRAQRTAQEIEEVAKNDAIAIDSLKIVELEGLRLISTPEDLVFALIEADAKVANRPLDELAEEYLQKVKNAIAEYRQKYSLKRKLERIALVVFETIIFMVILILLRKVLRRINRHIEVWKETRFRALRIQSWQLFSVEQQANLFLGFVRLIYWVTIAVLCFLYLAVLFHYFPQTEILSQAILSSFYNVLENFGKAFLSYLPNLFSILLTIVIAYYIIRFCQLFFNAIDRETLSLPGFDRDWARPTERLIVILIVALVLAVILPLLPGAQSPAFRGISIFVGALFTLGGASAIANLVGGFIIIYTRAFRVGDHVQIGNVQGDILEKTLLSTRIRTSKNKIVTIPNANLLTSNIENFTTAARDINEPVILHTTITLGYDVPWRQVHQVLIDAALSSPSILEQPAPFVLQTGLGDFSVSYELNAYTHQPSMMPKIYSQLHQNIQDKCNEAGIEILSPQYSAVRDGNHNTIPENYLPQDYTAPGFRVHPLGQLFNQLSHQLNQQKNNR